MRKSVSEFVSSFNNDLFSRYGDGLFVSLILSDIEDGHLKIKETPKEIDDYVDYPWLTRFEIVTEKIKAIASDPRTHIKFEKEVKLASKAVKIDNFDIIETLKVSKYWRQKGGKFLPEYVFTDNFETELAIYENRFIV